MAWPSYVGVLWEEWQIAHAVRQSPPSQDGTVQRVASLGDVWTARVTLRIRPENRIKWMAYVAGRRGSLRTFLVGPVLETSVVPATGSTVTSNAASGATSITLTVADSSAVPDQALLGLDSRLYIVTNTTVDSGTQVTLAIWPPLRSAITAGTSIDATPQATMHMVNPEYGRAELADVTEVTVELREAF